MRIVSMQAFAYFIRGDSRVKGLTLGGRTNIDNRYQYEEMPVKNFQRSMLFFLLGLCGGGVFAQSAIEHSPRALVHLLDYLAADYAGAVENGKVKDQGEYNEQVEFSQLVVESAASLKSSPNYPALEKQVHRLKDLIAKKENAAVVSKLAIEIKQSALQMAKLDVAPSAWSDLKNGKRIFEAQCAACHGVKGEGDGPAAKGLDPAPRNFHDDVYMREISAFHNFNVIRLGIPGTGMVAFPTISDKDTWDLAFYILSIRHQNKAAGKLEGEVSLKDAATLSDAELENKFSGSAEQKQSAVSALRLKEQTSQAAPVGASLVIARRGLAAAATSYKAGKFAEARHQALMAYLEGVEPVEQRLRSIDGSLVAEIEQKMADVRRAIEKKETPETVIAKIQAADVVIKKSEKALESEDNSPWVTFSLTAGILFREGFEAVLIILAILGVLRAVNARRAAVLVHSGWVSAVFLGIVAWFFSGWLILISGASREVTEATAAMLAVVVLLYMGFWLHSKTEIKRWTAFIDGKVKKALEGNQRWGLFALSFIAVFREAFETVLFLRALWIQGGDSSKTAMLSGVVICFALILIAAWALLKYSLKLPIRQLFGISSLMMIVLSVILVGKSVHSFQEAGWITMSPVNFVHFSFFGVYPSVEVLASQAATIVLSFVLWKITSRPSAA